MVCRSSSIARRSAAVAARSATIAFRSASSSRMRSDEALSSSAALSASPPESNAAGALGPR